MKLKICGISDIKTLEYLTDHPLAPAYIGFITNYPKSRRFVELNALKDLLKVDKKNSKYIFTNYGYAWRNRSDSSFLNG